MENPLKIKFNCNNFHLANFGFIEVDGEAIHRIKDTRQFYEALGYSEEAHQRGISHDEFIWEKYTKRGSEKSSDCLTAKLISYLKIHSAEFVEKYGAQVDEWRHAHCTKNNSGPGCNANCALLPANRE